MTVARVVIRGESYWTLEAVAESYQCEVTWLRTVYDYGLLGRGERLEGSVAVHVRQLDRVATILRLHVYQGLELSAVRLLLETDDE